ncbi:MAG: APC family permease [Actinomycetota bacterium]|nr:APC family permease [Actinomycetota bacterium]
MTRGEDYMSADVASGSSPTSGQGAPLFARASSGLVRELTLVDIAWYGIFATGGLFAYVFLFPGPQYASPGISIPLMLVFTLLLGVFVYFVYAALGSAMPRAGGDYLYESRTLHPLIGFTVPWACQLVFWLAFPASGAYVVTTFGLVPIFHAFGASGIEAWLLTKTGTFVVSAVVVIACWLLTVFGLRVYRPLQRYVLVPAIVLATLTIIGLLLANLGTNFAHKFNAYHAGTGITAASVIAAAGKHGFRSSSFNLGHTLLWVAVLAAYIPYSMYSAQGLLGEVKQAGSLQRLFTAFLIPGAVVALVMLALPFLLLTSIVGGTFMDQYAYAVGSGAITPGYSPNFSVFLSMLSQSKIITVLIGLGFISGGFGIANVVFANSSRVMMAMSLDGSLPKIFSEVSPRFHSPIKATTLWSLLALAVAAAFAYKPSWETTVLIGGAITSVLVVGVTCLGGALFPYRSRQIFDSAPAARYRLGSVPLVTIAGFIGAASVAALIYVAVTVPALGITSPGSRIAIGAAFVSGLLVYFGIRAYNRSKGVDTSLAYRVVPPE